MVVDDQGRVTVSGNPPVFRVEVLCSDLPLPGCLRPSVPLKSKLVIRNKVPDKGDTLVLKWLKGEETTAADIGDPTTTTDYVTCLYVGDPRPSIVAAAPAGGTCGAAPCWRLLGDPLGSKGAKYKDKERSPHGVSSVKVRTGEAEKAKLTVKAKGENLLLPLLPLSLPVVLQVQASNGVCWEASFFDVGVIRNDEVEFKGRAGSPSGAFVPTRSASPGY